MHRRVVIKDHDMPGGLLWLKDQTIQGHDSEHGNSKFRCAKNPFGRLIVISKSTMCSHSFRGTCSPACGEVHCFCPNSGCQFNQIEYIVVQSTLSFFSRLCVLVCTYVWVCVCVFCICIFIYVWERGQTWGRLELIKFGLDTKSVWVCVCPPAIFCGRLWRVLTRPKAKTQTVIRIQFEYDELFLMSELWLW